MSRADSRSRVLASIRRSLASGHHLPLNEAVPPVGDRLDSARRYSAAGPAAGGAPLAVELFASEFQALGGVVVRVDRTTAAGRVVELVAARGDTVLAWEEASLPVPGLYAALAQAGIRIAEPDVPPVEPARSAALAGVERVAVGVTGVDAVLADTGTLVLRSGPGRPRLASLSVRSHLALFTPDQLHTSWAAWGPAPGWVRAASNVALITGPSRTGDIEMTLTLGVHGPREVIAVLVGGD